MIMRKLIVILLVSIVYAVSSWGQDGFTQTGLTTYYHKKFEGRKTSSGERYHGKLYTAAHRKLPFGTMVKVTNIATGKWVIVRINDRGPFVKGRIIDLSYSAACDLNLVRHGSQKVKVEAMNPSDINLKNELPIDLAEKSSDSKYFNVSAVESTPVGFGVQIASYGDMENLFLFLSRIEKSVKEKLTVQVTEVKGKRVYRVLAGVFENKVLADSFAAKLAVDFPGCFSVEYINVQP